MKNKKIVSMIVMFSIFINIISGLHIDAQAENTENSETYLWDFSKYTDKITTTKTGFTEKYDGLTIAIADNGDDSISTGGVYWRGADVTVGITGIAGPTGGTKEKPVGLVYVGICVMGETEVKELHLNGTREEVRECTCKITFENIANRIENITKVQ